MKPSRHTIKRQMGGKRYMRFVKGKRGWLHGMGEGALAARLSPIFGRRARGNTQNRTRGEEIE